VAKALVRVQTKQGTIRRSNAWPYTGEASNKIANMNMSKPRGITAGLFHFLGTNIGDFENLVRFDYHLRKATAYLSSSVRDIIIGMGEQAQSS
jgi:hypothetical protein